ncbi:MAG TPA: hypothetical protein VFN81_08685 [Sphingomicrobium sp.]|nr:hypothetical protein [Sphingomicrobium sp.]
MSQKLSKERAEELIQGIDSEGLEYWLCDYTDECYPGTELASLILDARQALQALRAKIGQLRERYGLEEA